MRQPDLNWTINLMRAGYAGRGFAYLITSLYALYAIWRGGHAEGPEGVFGDLGSSTLGDAILIGIATGLLCYFVWRVICAIYDLENYGQGAKGAVARSGQLITGALHLAIAFAAIIAVFTIEEADQGGGSIRDLVSAALDFSQGWLVVLGIGIITVASGGYYLFKAYSGSYRKYLPSNHFTQTWNGPMEVGIAAQGLTIILVGVLLIQSGYRLNAAEAGGLGEVFDALSSKIYGQLMVSVLCLGLLGFALFCFVNAAYRIIPKLQHEDADTLTAWAKAKLDAT